MIWEDRWCDMFLSSFRDSRISSPFLTLVCRLSSNWLGYRIHWLMVDDSMPSIFSKVGYLTSDIQLRGNNLIPFPSTLLLRLGKGHCALQSSLRHLQSFESSKSNINNKIIVASALTNSCGFHFLYQRTQLQNMSLDFDFKWISEQPIPLGLVR